MVPSARRGATTKAVAASPGAGSSAVGSGPEPTVTAPPALASLAVTAATTALMPVGGSPAAPATPSDHERGPPWGPAPPRRAPNRPWAGTETKPGAPGGTPGGAGGGCVGAGATGRAAGGGRRGGAGVGCGGAGAAGIAAGARAVAGPVMGSPSPVGVVAAEPVTGAPPLAPRRPALADDRAPVPPPPSPSWRTSAK